MPAIRRPRPISRKDNPLTTGLPLNPNGTYVANPHPTTAAAGAQGVYGAMLPQVKVPTSVPGAGRLAASPVQLPRTPYPPYNNPITNPVNTTPYGPPAPLPPTPPPANVQLLNQGVPSYGAPVNVKNNVPTYSQSQGHPDPGLIRRLLNNPAEYDNLTPAQKDAVDNIASGTSAIGGNPGSGGGGNSDFMNTKFMQQNVANNVAFENQLRWDPQRKKYVQIGKLMKEGKLDNKGRWHKKPPRRGGGGGGGNEQQAAAPETPQVQETTGGFTGSYGIINFNTGTG